MIGDRWTEDQPPGTAGPLTSASIATGPKAPKVTDCRGANPGLFREALWGGVAPCCRDCSLHRFLADGLKVHAGGAPASPRAFYRHKHVGTVLRVVVLLLGRELDHPPALGRISERGEYLSAHAKIRMVHVGVLRRLRKSKGHAAKIIGGHGVRSPGKDVRTLT